MRIRFQSSIERHRNTLTDYGINWIYIRVCKYNIYGILGTFHVSVDVSVDPL